MAGPEIGLPISLASQAIKGCSQEYFYSSCFNICQWPWNGTPKQVSLALGQISVKLEST